MVSGGVRGPRPPKVKNKTANYDQTSFYIKLGYSKRQKSDGQKKGKPHATHMGELLITRTDLRINTNSILTNKSSLIIINYN